MTLFKDGASQRLTQSYYHQPSSEPLLSLTLGEVLERAASLAGDKIAHISHYQGIKKTYSEMETEVSQCHRSSTLLAAGLLSLGFERGDRLALWSPNSYQWIMIMFAAAKAGLVLVGVPCVTAYFTLV
ncbi:ACSF2 [Cordylochernes scorpioides]|uniref:ACSF2 n=1 Tax=Cordylochernes scorpioides TaxID=51811 RepID=A0ABY6K9S2_9ARAC|nr:ACSF2 [Cordylochernes scorpioides]